MKNKIKQKIIPVISESTEKLQIRKEDNLSLLLIGWIISKSKNENNKFTNLNIIIIERKIHEIFEENVNIESLIRKAKYKENIQIIFQHLCNINLNNINSSQVNIVINFAFYNLTLIEKLKLLNKNTHLPKQKILDKFNETRNEITNIIEYIGYLKKIPHEIVRMIICMTGKNINKQANNLCKAYSQSLSLINKDIMFFIKCNLFMRDNNLILEEYIGSDINKQKDNNLKKNKSKLYKSLKLLRPIKTRSIKKEIVPTNDSV